MYKDYEIKLNAILDKHGVQKVELGIIDEVKDRIKSSDKIQEKLSEAIRKIDAAKKAEKAVRQMTETQIKIQKELYSKASKAVSDLGIKEPKELKQLKTSTNFLDKALKKLPKIK